MPASPLPQPAQPASNTPPPKPAKPPRSLARRLLRGLLWALLALLIVLLLALGGLWIWAGQAGSLATVLRLAGAHVPLVTEEATGSLRQGGRIAKLVWGDEQSLRVEVQDAELLWQPAALLHGQLQIDTLSARRIHIQDNSPPNTEPKPPAAPPGQLTLPLGIEVKAIAADEFVWAGPPEVQAHDFRGRYHFNHLQHALRIDSLEVMDGRYQGDVQLGVLGKNTLDLKLQGVVSAPRPDAPLLPPLRAEAHASGPLEDLQVQLSVQADPAAEAELPARTQAKRETQAQAHGSAPAQAEPVQLSAKARITPWQAPLLPQLDARFQALDASVFLPQAPQTGLSGQLQLQPLDANTPLTENTSTSTSTPNANTPSPAPAEASDPSSAQDAPTAGSVPLHWRVQGQIRNAGSGPIDQQRLPLDALDIDADWRNGTAVVRALHAQLAGGHLRAHGQWKQPKAASAAPQMPPANSGETPSTLAFPPENSDPQANTAKNNPSTSASMDLGAWTLNAELSGLNPNAIHTQLDSFPLDGQIQAKGEGQLLDFLAQIQAQAQRRQKLNNPTLQALTLHDLNAKGRWDGSALTLSELRVRASEAELSGKAHFVPAQSGGGAQLALTLPGTTLTLEGDLAEQSGRGKLQLQVANLQRTQAWLKRLPGLPQAVSAAQASGQATLNANWQGGWRKPTVQADLRAPQLTWQPAGGQGALGLSQLNATLQGGLDQAALSVSGTGSHGERSAQLQTLNVQATRTTPARPVGESNWRVNLQSLQAQLKDPALGQGHWQVALAQAVQAQWQAAQGKGRPALNVAAGQLTLSSPAPVHTARIEWEPLRWQGSQISSTGRIVGLPFAWAEHVAGPALQEAGIRGDMVFDANWDAQIGQQLRLNAGLTHRSGDLTVLRVDPSTQIETRIRAGLKQVALSVSNTAERLQADVRWDSETFGQASGQVSSRLVASRNAEGGTSWRWPESAPLSGQIALQLPRISTWSVLAPPGWRLQGSVNAALQVGGTRSAPLLNGTLQADDLAMRSVVDGLSFQNGRLRARIDGQRLLLDEFSLQGFGAQGGRLVATGEAGLSEGKPSAQMRIDLQKLRASIHQDRQVTVSGNLTASLQDMLARVNGRVNVDQALILLPESSAPRLGSDVVVRGAKGIATTRTASSGATRDPLQQAASQKPAPKAAAANSAPLRLLADVKLNLGQDFRLRGMGINTLLKGELTLAANGPVSAMPRLTGDVQTEGGTFKAYGQNLNIQRGLIRFTGPIDNPTLDIRAVRPNYTSDQRVGVVVQGNALLPVISLYSNPTLPDSEVLAWLLLGRAAPESGAEAAMLQSAAMAVLGGTGESLASRIGLDELSFGAGGNSSDASITLGKRLSDNLYASYERSISGVTGTLMIYLELSRRWTLRGQAGDDSAIDLLFRLSYD